MIRLPEAFGALRERPFRLLWTGQATSAIGDAMTPVALVFAVLHATGSAGDLGIVLAAYTLAHAVFVLAGGVWGDRLERRLVMLAVRPDPRRRPADAGRARDPWLAGPLGVRRARGRRRRGRVVLQPRLDGTDPADDHRRTAAAGQRADRADAERRVDLRPGDLGGGRLHGGRRLGVRARRRDLPRQRRLPLRCSASTPRCPPSGRRSSPSWRTAGARCAPAAGSGRA